MERRGEFAITSAVGAAVCAGVALVQYRWPCRSYEQYIVLNVALLLWVPLLAIMLTTRAQPSEYGLARGDERLSRVYGWGLFAAVLPVLVVGAHLPSSRAYYPLYRQFPRPGPATWHYLIYFEAVYGLYLFSWEWFFRGYLLFGLSRSIGGMALFPQAVLFGLLHYGKPWPEFASSFVTGLVLGFTAMRVGSFFPGFVVHWAAATAYDLLVLAGVGFRLPP